MILIVGGTTEGRAAVRVADEAGNPYAYSTKGDRQEIRCLHGIRLTGALDEAAMTAYCRAHSVVLIVDAAHPFAAGVHQTVAATAHTLQIPVVRYERQYPPRDEAFVWCDDYADAVRRLQADGISRLLALTGVNTIAPLAGYWQSNLCWFRILNREESLQLARAAGFPPEQLVFYRENEAEALIGRLGPEAILTKESGYSGGFTEKAEAARKLGIPLYVVKRPSLAGFFYTVYGEEGLRKQIERLAPGFFPLRSGYTTGACATAAAKAALLTLLGIGESEGKNGAEPKEVGITLPSGEEITLPVASTRRTATSAICTVIKESGDDPDVTNGCCLVAEVEIRPFDREASPQGKKTNGTLPPHGEVFLSLDGKISESEAPHSQIPAAEDAPKPAVPLIRLRKGEGIGTVTLPGLGLEIGAPAVNATPRRMIARELTAVWQAFSASKPSLLRKTGDRPEIILTLSVPGGDTLALRTFNPKLGIVGGISIIGTSGIVRPFSSEAFIASIRKEAEVAKAVGCKKLVINSGAKSERFLKNHLAGEGEAIQGEQAFIHYGNFIGETVRVAAALGFREVILGIMIGKAVKLAEGALDTHSKKGVMNKTFLQSLAQEAGCGGETIRRIGEITLARELTELLTPEESARFFPLLLRKCREQVAPLLPKGNLRILLIGDDGRLICQTPTIRQLSGNTCATDRKETYSSEQNPNGN